MRRILPEGSAFFILTIAVGLISGLGATGFHFLIEGTHLLLVEGALHTFAPWHLALGPIAGALIAVGLTHWFAPNDQSHGTSAVMESVALRGGRLAARPLLVKSSAAGILIGAGGSVGPEDPSVQIGAVIGSSLGQRLRLSEARLKALVAAGVAGAIAAAFNAPLAGVFFALEVIAAEFSTTLLAPVVLAAVAASVVGQAILGSEPAFSVPDYALVTPALEIPLYGLLGLLAAGLGAFVIRAIFAGEALFDRLRLPWPARALLGGALVGLIALFYPEVLGVGYPTTGALLNGVGPVGLALALLLAAKLIATVITLGAVRVGGTFAPSLVLGAMLGSLYGGLVDRIFPALAAPPAAYALVGAGAVLTAVVRAPITAVLLVFEITNDYRIILPIMASVVVSTVAAQGLHRESIYTERLARHGIQLRFGRDINVLEMVSVGEAMSREPLTVQPELRLSELEELFDRTRHHGLPVVREHRLLGMVTMSDLERARLGPDGETDADGAVAEVMTTNLVTVYPDESLNTAMRRFAEAGVGRLPVVSRDDPKEFLGLLRRDDVIKAYNLAALRRTEMEQRLQQLRVRSRSGGHLFELEIPGDSRAADSAIRDLGLPRPAIITAIRRNGQHILPHGATMLRAGDRITLLTDQDQADEVRACFAPGTAPPVTPGTVALRIKAGSPAIGKRVAELELPPSVLIITLCRNAQTRTVHGGTRLEADDEVTVMVAAEELLALVKLLAP